MENGGCVNATHILDTCTLVSFRRGKKFECILWGVHEEKTKKRVR